MINAQKYTKALVESFNLYDKCIKVPHSAQTSFALNKLKQFNEHVIPFSAHEKEKALKEYETNSFFDLLENQAQELNPTTFESTAIFYISIVAIANASSSEDFHKLSKFMLYYSCWKFNNEFGMAQQNSTLNLDVVDTLFADGFPLKDDFQFCWNAQTRQTTELNCSSVLETSFSKDIVQSKI
jgi:hypothetical protein